MNEKLLLTLLRWDVDYLAFLAEYDDYYWLKPCFNSKGERIGITACCSLDYECKRHKEIRNKTELQNANNN